MEPLAQPHASEIEVVFDLFHLSLTRASFVVNC